MKDFTIVYASRGIVYLRWALCSILSLRKQGLFNGNVVLLLGSPEEGKYAKEIIPEVHVVVKAVEKPANWPAYMYKVLLLAALKETDFEETRNVLFFDNDVFIYRDIDPFLKKISGAFWIDRIHNNAKSRKYIRAVETVVKDEGLGSVANYREFNSGCWSSSWADFFNISQLTYKLSKKYYDLNECKWIYAWTDQPFFTTAAMMLGLNNLVVEEHNDAQIGYNYHTFHINKGFYHVQGFHRANKADWKYLLKKHGLIHQLRLLSNLKLDRSSYKKFWQGDYNANRFFVNKNRMKFLNLYKNDLKLKWAEFLRYRELSNSGFDGRL